VSSADSGKPLTAAEIGSHFAHLADLPVLVLAVSGGPDSTALMVLAARWRNTLGRGPRLVAVTIDHGLRPEARHEASAVRKLARVLAIEHRTLRWTGPKPAAGLQDAARQARCRLLAGAARAAKAGHVLTAHTRDDQAETVLLRLMRGSGIGGLAGMTAASWMPVPAGSGIVLVRPLLDVPKSRLLATLKAGSIAYADDRSNRDPRFARPRLRELMPLLEGEGLTAGRLATLARRMARADAAIEAAVFEAAARLAPGPWPLHGAMSLAVPQFMELAAEVALRLLGRAVAAVGDEGPVELAKLEALCEALVRSPTKARFRRSLAGAVVTLAGDRLTIERAPPRRRSASKRP
jgi:tRNA(Ile)-lysidine synthase